jgi:putative colanic acid biosynthesis UDP-glucose lipid carrier transferase
MRDLFPVVDLLMAAAWADGEIEARERNRVREVIAELASTDTNHLPLSIERRIATFDPEKFDLDATVSALRNMTARERRRFVAMVRSVCEANDAFDIEEDRFIMAVVLALALSEADVGDLVLKFADGLTGPAKRLFDMAFSATFLAASWPLLLGIAAGVKLTSKGPVLFRQRRYGLGATEIDVFKFRTMRVLEDGAEVKQATKRDPRVTRFGAFLRRTSLDELPQFFNVLRGDMTVVGPRPHAVAHNAHYRTQILEYMLRHKVKPGITGWAQVNGARGETDTLDKMVARVEYDLEYMKRYSLVFDVWIVWLTVFGRKVRSNAY